MRALRALDGICLFYLACAGFRLLALGLVAFGILTGVLAQSVGGRHLGEWFAALGYYAGAARDSIAAMLVVAGLGVAVIAYRTRHRLPAQGPARGWVTLVLAAACALTAVADWRYGVTPLAELLPRGASPLATTPPALVLTVHDFMSLRDAQVGVLAEVTGVLDYHERMHRFALRDPDRRESINVMFHRGGRSPFDEGFGPPGPPKYYAEVARYVGRPVRVKGQVLRSQVDVDIRDIVALDVPAAVAPAAVAR